MVQDSLYLIFFYYFDGSMGIVFVLLEQLVVQNNEVSGLSLDGSLLLFG